MSQTSVLVIPSEPSRSLSAQPTNPDVLRDTFQTFHDNKRSANTMRVYTTQWQQFVDWCAVNGLQPAPCSPATLMAYVAEIRNRGKSTQTLNLVLSAIKYNLMTRRCPDPTLDVEFKEMMKGARRTMAENGQAQRRVAPTLTLDDLRRMANACGDTLTGLRNRALLLVTFGGWFRRSEALTLKCDQLTWESRRVLVLLDKTKTNQLGDREERVELARVPGTHSDFCPYTALRTWLDAAGIIEGPVFRKIYKGTVTIKGLTDGNWFWRLLQDLATRGGVKTHVTPHRSLRATPITLAITAGQTMPSVMKRARHKKPQTTTLYFDETAAGQTETALAVYGE